MSRKRKLGLILFTVQVTWMSLHKAFSSSPHPVAGSMDLSVVHMGLWSAGGSMQPVFPRHLSVLLSWDALSYLLAHFSLSLSGLLALILLLEPRVSYSRQPFWVFINNFLIKNIWIISLSLCPSNLVCSLPLSFALSQLQDLFLIPDFCFSGSYTLSAPFSMICVSVYICIIHLCKI